MNGHGYGYGFAIVFLLALLMLPVAGACELRDGVVSGRYRDLQIPDLWVNCSDVPASACYYSVNDYANVTLADCSNFTFSGLFGHDTVTLCGSNGTAWNCTKVSVWIRNDGSSFDYVLLMVLVAVFVLCFVMGEWTGQGFWGVIAMIAGVLIGFEVLTVSVLCGAVLMLVLPLACLFYIIRK